MGTVATTVQTLLARASSRGCMQATPLLLRLTNENERMHAFLNIDDVMLFEAADVKVQVIHDLLSFLSQRTPATVAAAAT